MTNPETEQPPEPKHSLVRQVLLGAFWGNAGMFLVAPIVAVLYQFPVYPYGKIGGLARSFTIGWDQLLGDMVLGVYLTVLVGMVGGGFVVLGLLGAAAGGVSYGLFWRSVENLYWRTIACALAVDVVVAVAVAFYA